MRKAISGYEGIYEIDESGRVYTLRREFTNSIGRRIVVKEKERSPILHNTGYSVVTLSKNNTVKTYRLHRLVAQEFIPNPQNKPFVNHINGIKTDNRKDNLEWVTPLENTEHAISNGLFSIKGFSNPASKLTKEQVDDAFSSIQEGELIKDIAARMGVNRNTITKAVNSYKGGHGLSIEQLRARGWVGRNSKIQNRALMETAQ